MQFLRLQSATQRIARLSHHGVAVRGSPRCTPRRPGPATWLRQMREGLPLGGGSAAGLHTSARRLACATAVADTSAGAVTFDTGSIAPMADGAVLATQGNAAVLATAVMSRSLGAEADFLPLTVDYREKASAFGVVPKTRNRREGMTTDHEILGARILDRTVRPLFAREFFNETQIIATLHSYDPEVDPETLAVNAACAALSVSPVPWKGPAAAVRVGWRDGAPVVMGSRKERLESPLDLLYAGTADNALMIEAHGQVPTDDFAAALEFAHGELEPLIKAQNELREAVGHPELTVADSPYPTPELLQTVFQTYKSDAKEFWRTPHETKASRSEAQSKLTSTIMGALVNYSNTSATSAALAIDLLFEAALREVILDGGDHAVRIDGRGVDTVRPIDCKVDVIHAPHGSSVFARGDTQALCTATLAPPKMVQDPPSVDLLPKHFFLHYEFPPYCVNEVGRVGGVNRRMVGHGALAEKALAQVVPPVEKLGYSVRVTSEVTGSDGSSSMATVCGGCLALMDAGVNIRNPVAGVSVGLITPIDPMTGTAPADDDAYVLLTDILGTEDHFGDMDFKVAGTRENITAVQLDIKLDGVPVPLLTEALGRAETARTTILDEMEAVMPHPRRTKKDTAPTMSLLPIPSESRTALLSMNRASLRAIEASTGVSLVMEETRDFLQAAVHDLLHPPVAVRVGTIYKVKVDRVLNFGVMVSILGLGDPEESNPVEERLCLGHKGLLHVGQWQSGRIRSVPAVEGTVLYAIAHDVNAAGDVNFSRIGLPNDLKGLTHADEAAEADGVEKAEKAETA